MNPENYDDSLSLCSLKMKQSIENLFTEWLSIDSNKVN